MFVESKNLIFVHVPKTAGNFLQRTLAPLSPDRLLTAGHRDGEDRFDLEGPYTPRKHATLAEYREAMGRDLFDRCRIMTCVRHPADRCLSFFFSPHRGMRPRRRAQAVSALARRLGIPVELGPEDYTYVQPDFTLAGFEELVQQSLTMTAFFQLDGAFQRPHYVLSQERLRGDVGTVFPELGLPLPSNWNIVNPSGSPGMRDALIRDEAVLKLVYRYQRTDYDNFGYDLHPGPPNRLAHRST